MPTSRYCDHAPCASSTSFTFAASGEPGTMPARLSPSTAPTAARVASALPASPRACSSITRSSRLSTKVTPLALTACKSIGASSQGSASSRELSSLLASTASKAAIRGAEPASIAARTSEAGASRSNNALAVGAMRDKSCKPPRCRATSTGPTSGCQMRPTSVARSAPCGRLAAGDSSRDMLRGLR